MNSIGKWFHHELKSLLVVTYRRIFSISSNPQVASIASRYVRSAIMLSHPGAPAASGLFIIPEQRGGKLRAGSLIHVLVADEIHPPYRFLMPLRPKQVRLNDDSIYGNPHGD
jgi:hypothetical protein